MASEDNWRELVWPELPGRVVADQKGAIVYPFLKGKSYGEQNPADRKAG